MTPIALRPATPADSEFCFQLHKAAMGRYISAIWHLASGAGTNRSSEASSPSVQA